MKVFDWLFKKKSKPNCKLSLEQYKQEYEWHSKYIGLSKKYPDWAFFINPFKYNRDIYLCFLNRGFKKVYVMDSDFFYDLLKGVEFNFINTIEYVVIVKKLDLSKI